MQNNNVLGADQIFKWLPLDDRQSLRDAFERLLLWAQDEFDREDILPAALSQRYSFRRAVPRHLIVDFDELLSFLPGPDWKPAPSLLVFISTPDQFSARLALAHDYCIRHQTRSVLLISDYFDNQSFRQPAETFKSLNEREEVRLALALYSVFGFTLLPLID